MESYEQLYANAFNSLNEKNTKYQSSLKEK